MEKQLLYTIFIPVKTYNGNIFNVNLFTTPFFSRLKTFKYKFRYKFSQNILSCNFKMLMNLYVCEKMKEESNMPILRKTENKLSRDGFMPIYKIWKAGFPKSSK